MNRGGGRDIEPPPSGARWLRVHRGADPTWAFMPGDGGLDGIVFYRHGVEWCAHTPSTGTVHTGLAFADAVARVEQAAGFLA